MLCLTIVKPIQAKAVNNKVTVHVENSGAKIIKGNEVLLTATLKNAEMKKVSFQSITKSIAKVTSAGQVIGKKAGTAKIKVTVTAVDRQKFVKTVKIYVKNQTAKNASHLEVTGLKTIAVGNKASLSYNLKKSSKIAEKPTFKSGNEAIAKVNKDGVITAKSGGTVNITVSATNEDGFTLKTKQKITVPKNKLTRSGGVNYYKGQKETWYTQKQLPGKGLKIPGRHVRKDGVICDKDGYVVVALHSGNKGKIVETSLGTGKCYDKNGTKSVDIYTNW